MSNQIAMILHQLHDFNDSSLLSIDDPQEILYGFYQFNTHMAWCLLSNQSRDYHNEGTGLNCYHRTKVSIAKKEMADEVGWLMRSDQIVEASAVVVEDRGGNCTNKYTFIHSKISIEPFQVYSEAFPTPERSKRNFKMPIECV